MCAGVVSVASSNENRDRVRRAAKRGHIWLCVLCDMGVSASPITAAITAHAMHRQLALILVCSRRASYHSRLG